MLPSCCCWKEKWMKCRVRVLQYLGIETIYIYQLGTLSIDQGSLNQLNIPKKRQLHQSTTAKAANSDFLPTAKTECTIKVSLARSAALPPKKKQNNHDDVGRAPGPSMLTTSQKAAEMGTPPLLCHVRCRTEDVQTKRRMSREALVVLQAWPAFLVA